jgi:hypothetical protein
MHFIRCTSKSGNISKAPFSEMIISGFVKLPRKRQAREELIISEILMKNFHFTGFSRIIGELLEKEMC